MGLFGSDEKPKEEKSLISIPQLVGAATKAMATGNWDGVFDLIKPLLAPSIGKSLLHHDKSEGVTNSCYIITKKVDDTGEVNVFLSVVERPINLEYVKDKEGQPIVREIGDLMDIIMMK